MPVAADGVPNAVGVDPSIDPPPAPAAAADADAASALPAWPLLPVAAQGAAEILAHRASALTADQIRSPGTAPPGLLASLPSMAAQKSCTLRIESVPGRSFDCANGGVMPRIDARRLRLPIVGVIMSAPKRQKRRG